MGGPCLAQRSDAWMTKRLSLWMVAVLSLVPMLPAHASPAAVPAVAAPAAQVSHAVPSASDWVWDGQTGFDWAARVDHTHVMADANRATTHIPLDKIVTAYVDIELTGLQASLPVVIQTTAGRVHNDAAYSDGKLVVWHLEATPMTLTVTDAASGDVLTNVVMSYLADALDGLDAPKSNYPPQSGKTSDAQRQAKARPCGACGDPGSVWEDPYSYTYTREAVPMYVNGAASFTDDITIRVDACWEHANAIGFHVSGGYAAASGTAGGAKTHTREVCAGMSSTGGFLQVAGPMAEFEKDTYKDGSWKIYASSNPWGYSSVSWSWNPARCCYLLQFQNCARNHGQYYAVAEKNSGAIKWDGSYNAFGVSGTVTTSSTTTNAANVRFECHATDDALHQYTMYLVAGDGVSSGMVGAAWKDY